MKVLALVLLLLFSGSSHAADFKPFVRGSWKQLLEENAGKPIIVHFWGVTCAPCLAELPNWTRMVKQYPDLRVILIAADPFPQEAARVSEIIDSAGLGSAENWTFADRFVERLRFEIDPRWVGELPRTLLIDKSGAVKSYSGLFDLALVPLWVKGQK